MKIASIWLSFVLVYAVPSTLSAALKLPSVFASKMVLQRDKPIKVWGTADAGQEVRVSLAGKSVSGKVDAGGKWSVSLPVMPAGGPHQMKVFSGSDSLTFDDVLIGEVWICSGQSNMAMGYGGNPEIKTLLNKAQNKHVRHFTVTTKVSLTPNDDVVGSWQQGFAGSAVAATFAHDLSNALGENVPVAVILTCWGSSSIEGWMPLDLTEQLPHFKQVMADFEVNDKARVIQIIETEKQTALDKKKGHRWGSRSDEIFARTRPNILYNAMMHGLVPFAVRGLVWYQGEANSKTRESQDQYGKSLPVWAKRLRLGWQDESMHFLAVMLPGFGRGVSDLNAPTEPSWAFFRESQSKLEALPNAKVANTIDLGDPKNIHPKDKRPIGWRLSRLALKYVHGQQILGEGPRMDQVNYADGKASILFKHAKGLKTLDGKKPKGFWIAGKDNRWYPAKAEIVGESVVLTSDKVSAPVAVRYAFAAKPDVNLVNEADLPAYPFRTDE